MEAIYPTPGTKIFIPVELDGSQRKAIFEVAHREPSTKIFWHLDDQFMGTTQLFHQKAVLISTSKHKLIIIDENGERIETNFEVVN